jgi:hypothetical protein
MRRSPSRLAEIVRSALRPLLLLGLVVALMAPGAAFAQEEDEEEDADADVEEYYRPPNVAEKIFDGGILRPLSFTQMVVGGALLVPTGLIALTGGVENARITADVFVGQPYRDTFGTGLGEF